MEIRAQGKLNDSLNPRSDPAPGDLIQTQFNRLFLSATTITRGGLEAVVGMLRRLFFWAWFLGLSMGHFGARSCTGRDWIFCVKYSCH